MKRYGGIYLVIIFSTCACLIYALSFNEKNSFLFDDYPNLMGLHDVTLSNPSSIFHFSTNGISSTLGRPISLLTFALQAHSWPNNAAAFKWVNLAIHLINGLLLFLCIYRAYPILRPHTKESSSLWIAACLASVWLILPIHVSSVHYVIQRMTLLSATFVLISFIIFINFWSTKPYSIQRILVYMLCIGLTQCIAILSKENGILFSIFALLFTIAAPQRPTYLRSALLVATPTLLFFLMYLTVNFQSILSGYSYRSFSLTERLLTQSEILIEYIQQIIIPNPLKLSLLHDNYPISNTLLEFSTSISVGLIISLITSAIYLRKKVPVFSFGILFYFAGHLLESTIFPLELYFEHRNYLPSIGILVAISACIWKFPYQKILKGLSPLFIFYFLYTTYQQCQLWGEPIRQAQYWLMNNPSSPRAQLYWIDTLTSIGKNAEAYHFTQQMNQSGSNQLYALIEIKLGCTQPEAAEHTQNVLQKLRDNLYLQQISAGQAIVQLQQIISAFQQNQCPYISPNNIMTLLEIWIKKPLFSNNLEFEKLIPYLNIAMQNMLIADRQLSQLYLKYRSPDLLFDRIQLNINLGKINIAVQLLKNISKDIELTYPQQLRFENLQHSLRAFQ